MYVATSPVAPRRPAGLAMLGTLGPLGRARCSAGLGQDNSAYGYVPGMTTPLQACTSALDGGDCATLVSMGANDQLLLAVGAGDIDFPTALNELNGSSSAGLPNVQSSFTDQFLGGPGAVLNTGAAAASSVANAASNVASTLTNAATGGVSGLASWFGTYGPWILGGAALLLGGILVLEAAKI
jgi:hypothetical protein